jgi:hypothetical protein
MAVVLMAAFLEGFASVSTGKSKLQLIIKSAFLKAFRLKH